MQNHTTDSFTKNIEAIVMGVLMFFVSFTFGNIAQAQELGGDADPEIERSEHLQRMLTELNGRVATLKQSLKDARATNMEIKDDIIAERKADRQEVRKTNRAEFEASIADLSPEEQKERRRSYLDDLRAQVEAIKQANIDKRDTRNDARINDRTSFDQSIQSLTPQQKLAALAARLQQLLDGRTNRTANLTERLDALQSDETSSADETTVTSSEAKADLKVYLKKEGAWFNAIDRNVVAAKRLRLKWNTQNVDNCTIALEYQDGTDTHDLTAATGKMSVDRVKAEPARGLQSATLTCEDAEGNEVSDVIDVQYYAQEKTYKEFVAGVLTETMLDVHREYALAMCLKTAADNLEDHVFCMHGDANMYLHGSADEVGTASAESALETELGSVPVLDSDGDGYESGADAAEDTGVVFE